MTGDGATPSADGSDESTAGDPDEPATDGGVQSYTVRLELVDEPGELLRALEPIASNGGNLLSIHHERGNVTPLGHIPVEVDVESPADRFDDIVGALRDAGVNVIQAGAERFGEQMNVLLVGHLVDTDLSDTLSRLEEGEDATVVDLSLAAPDGTSDVSSARLRLAVDAGTAEATMERVRSIADEKGLRVVEPLIDGEERV